MWNMLFGPSAAAKKDIPKKAILDVRQQLEMLQKKERHLEQQIEEQDAIARKHVQSNKQAAMTALKRKKTHSNHLASTQSQIATLEQQMHSVEAANLNVESLKVLKSTNTAMKVIHAGMNVDKVDGIMEDIREQQQIAEEINSAIVSIGDTDNTELEEALASMEQEMLDDKMLTAPSAPVASTPHVSVVKGKAMAQEEEDDEEELRQLKAQMAITS